MRSSVTDVLQRLFSEARAKLGQVKTLRSDVRATRVSRSFRKVRTRIERLRQRFVFADATDHPVHGTGRILDGEIACFTVPRYAPAHRPAVARAHRAAVL